MTGRKILLGCLMAAAALSLEAAAAHGARIEDPRKATPAKRTPVEITIESRSQCDILRKSGIDPGDCAPGKIERRISARQMESLRAAGIACRPLGPAEEKSRSATKMRSHFRKK